MMPHLLRRRTVDSFEVADVEKHDTRTRSRVMTLVKTGNSSSAARAHTQGLLAQPPARGMGPAHRGASILHAAFPSFKQSVPHDRDRPIAIPVFLRTLEQRVIL